MCSAVYRGEAAFAYAPHPYLSYRAEGLAELPAAAVVPFETQIPKCAQLLSEAKLRIQAEGPRSPIGDGTPFEIMKQWAEAGAVNQCSTDAYITGGATNAWRMLQYAKDHPEKKLAINLHWAWAPHAHLVMAYDDTVCPVAEFPMTEHIPKEYLDGPYLLAPDWPGIYCIV